MVFDTSTILYIIYKKKVWKYVWKYAKLQRKVNKITFHFIGVFFFASWWF